MKRVAAGLVLLLGLLPGQARADLITFAFQATVGAVPSGLSGTFSVGDAISGTFTFDTDTLDLEAALNAGRYQGAVTDLAFVVDGYSGSEAAGLNQVGIRDGAGGFDQFLLNSPFSGASVNSYNPVAFTFDLRDSTQTAFTSDDLPTTLDLSDFNTQILTLSFRLGSAAPVDLRARITSVETVPVPSTILLLGSGLAGLGTLAWRRRR